MHDWKTMTYSQRDFGKMMLSSVPMATGFSTIFGSSGLLRALVARPDFVVHGIRLGTISFSFKELKRTVGEAQWPEVLSDCQQCGLSNLEIEIAKVEPVRTLTGGGGGRAAVVEVAAAVPTPYGTACVAPVGVPRAAPAPPMTPEEQAAAKAVREEIRQFRVTAPSTYYANIKKQANAAGININAYTCGWGSDYTDAEIDAVFLAAKALGAVTINSSTSLEMAKRLAPFADKHQFQVAFHGHLFGLFSNSDDYASTLALSRYFRINLDIGHFTAACGDAVALIKLNHDKLPSIHIKDYKTAAGPSMSWGQGDSPIKPVMQLLKSLKYPGVITIEYDYPIPAGSNSIAEVEKCRLYLQEALA
jgi:sugar phosphate isomerase/epimerase